jgi:hypothetical protein
MPLRALLPSPIIVLVLACGPSHADPVADDESSTGASDDDDDAPATTDDEGPVGSTSSSGVDPDDDTTDAPIDTSSTESDASTGSSESGDPTAAGGRFELTGMDAITEPGGCLADDDARDVAWTIEFELPTEPGDFVLVEAFGPYVSEYACTLADGAFACTHETVVDYGRFSGLDASVHHVSSYDAVLDDDALAGTYSADFSCTGTECDDVLDQWQLVGFPCVVDVPFTGALVPER